MTITKLTPRKRTLTQAATNVNVEVYFIIRVINQVSVCDLDEGIQVVLLPIRVKCITGNLHKERVAKRPLSNSVLLTVHSDSHTACKQQTWKGGTKTTF